MTTGTVSSDELLNQTVSLGGGTVYSQEIKNYKKGGFRIASVVNDPTGDLVAKYFLESWDSVTNKWAEDTLALFDKHPNGVAITTSDYFKSTQAEKYRVRIDPVSGSSNVLMSASMQTEE